MYANNKINWLFIPLDDCLMRRDNTDVQVKKIITIHDQYYVNLNINALRLKYIDNIVP